MSPLQDWANREIVSPIQWPMTSLLLGVLDQFSGGTSCQRLARSCDDLLKTGNSQTNPTVLAGMGGERQAPLNEELPKLPCRTLSRPGWPTASRDIQLCGNRSRSDSVQVTLDVAYECLPSVPLI